MLNTHMKDKLRRGKPVFGTFVKENSPRLIELYGRAGFDYVILDGEHGAFSLSEAENMVRAADSVNMSSILRIPDCTEASVLHGLDIGAGGVQIPSLVDVEVARYGAQFSRYYPLGNRGMSVDQRSADYGMAMTAGYLATDYFKHANENVSLVLQVEKKEMVNQIEELCKIPQLDIIFIGPGDLSQSLGKPGQMDDPEVQEAIKHVCEVGLHYKKIVGTIVMNPSQFKKYIDMGMLYMSISTDFMIYGKAIKELAKGFEQYK